MKRLLLLLAAVFCIAAASDPAERLPDPAQEARARAEIGSDEGNATQMAGPQEVDIRGLIASMPERVPFVQPMPG